MAKRLFSLKKDDRQSLYKRYLFWLYKTTKDEIDKIDRKFTQLDIDNQIQGILKKKTGRLKSSLKKGISPFLEDLKEYIFQKESDAQKLKFSEAGEPNHKYLFLYLKLEAIMDTVKLRLGRRTLEEFKGLYEEAAIKRVLEDTSGRR